MKYQLICTANVDSIIIFSFTYYFEYCILYRELLAVNDLIHQVRKTEKTSAGEGTGSCNPGIECTHLMQLKLVSLVQHVERVIMMLDDALLEARRAREAMLLYVQVCRDQSFLSCIYWS